MRLSTAVPGIIYLLGWAAFASWDITEGNFKGICRLGGVLASRLLLTGRWLLLQRGVKRG